MWLAGFMHGKTSSNDPGFDHVAEASKLDVLHGTSFDQTCWVIS